MKEFVNIHYTDAYYILEDGEVLNTKLPHNEAYGYIHESQRGLIVRFIKGADTTSEESTDTDFVIKGLVIPKGAVLSASKENFIEGLHNLSVGQNISLTWNDVVIVANDSVKDCPIMYTEGRIEQNNTDHLVIGNSETIRIEPLPIRNHPAIRPLYYIIPKAFIVSFEKIETLKNI
jgi:hypothetical protein